MRKRGTEIGGCRHFVSAPFLSLGRILSECEAQREAGLLSLISYLFIS
jgi:hypothetical protein